MTKPWEKAEKKPAAAASSPRVLPMELRIGDRFTDSSGEWEVVSTPHVTGGGKDAHISVRRVGATEIRLGRATAGRGRAGKNDKMTEQFILRASSPAQWHGSARSLKDCADLVFAAHLSAIHALAGGHVSAPVIAHLMPAGSSFSSPGWRSRTS